ncbi:MAG: LmeA family phospholipid-binding protein [Bacillota bacterium]
MPDLKKARLLIENYLKFKAVRVTILSLGGIFLLVLALEGWLNYWVRASLKESLGWGAGPQVKIAADLNWLSLYDLSQGRIRNVRVRAKNCLLSNLRFASLNLDNRGFTFNLPLLLKESRLEIKKINATKAEAVVTAAAFSDYLNLSYPQFKPAVDILPGELILAGQAPVFGTVVPVQIAGGLNIISPKDLRFYPTRLTISGREVPKDFLRFAGNQVPLSFSLLKGLPLQLETVALKKGFAYFSFKEID